jgi:hypothetical protein
VVVTADGLDIEQVAGGMRAKGWVLLGNEKPPSIHLTVDPMTDETIRLFVNDLTGVVDSIRAGETVERGSLDYGLATGRTTPRWIDDAVGLIFGRLSDDS